MSGSLYFTDKEGVSHYAPSMQTKEEIDQYLDYFRTNLLSLQEANEQLIQERDDLWAAYQQREKNATADALYKFYSDNFEYGFPVMKDEAKAIQKWEDHHDEVQHNNKNHDHGTIGGGFTYEFSRSSIGVFGRVVCPTCQTKARAAAIKDGKFNSDLYNNYMEQHYATFYFQEP